MLKRWQVLLIGALVAFAGLMSLSFYGVSFFMGNGQIVPGPVNHALSFLAITGHVGWFAANLFHLLCVYAGFVMPSRRPSRRKRALTILVLAVALNLIGLRLGYMMMSLNGLILIQSLFSVLCYGAGLAYLIWSRNEPLVRPRKSTRPHKPEPVDAHLKVASQVEDGPNWHETLLATLRDTGAQETPRPKRWPLILAFGTLTALAQIIPRITEALFKDPGQQLIIGYIETPLILVLLAWPVALIRRQLAQIKMRRAEDALKKTVDKRPIFYLRSFGLDEELGRPSILELFLNMQPPNAEQTLTPGLSRSGPVIAIGRPGEKLPALGAARFYVSHERWQEKVADVATLSQLVVWASGTTPGLQWEISHLVRSLPPEKLILWAHPHLLDLDENEREAEWAVFVRGLGQLFPVSLPLPLGDIRFFAFDKDFRPIPYEGNGALAKLLTDKAIAPYDAAGVVRTKALRKWVFRGGAAVAALLALVIIGFGVMRALPLKPEPLSWNLLASDLISDERSSSQQSAEDVIKALKDTEAELKPRWFGKNWYQVPPGRLGPLSRSATTYRAAFETAHTDPAIEAIFYGNGPSQVFLIDGLPMARTRLKLINDLRRALEPAEAEWRQRAAETPTYVFPGRLHAYIVARQEMLDAEALILRSLVNHPDNWSIGYNLYNERVPKAYPDSYRDQLQALIDERNQAVKNFRTTQAELY